MRTMAWAGPMDAASIDAVDQEDRRLLAAYRASADSEALGTLARRHLDRAYRVAARVAGSGIDAEDVVHEAWMRLMRRAAAYAGRGSVRSWILACVANEARHWRRPQERRRRRERMAASGTIAEADADGDDVQSEVRAALEALPERYRLAISLRFLDGLAVADVAAALGCPEKTVRTRLDRGLARIRGQLQRTHRQHAQLGALLAAGPAVIPPELEPSLAEALRSARIAKPTAAGASGIAAWFAVLPLVAAASVAGWLMMARARHPPRSPLIRRRPRRRGPRSTRRSIPASTRPSGATISSRPAVG